MLVTRYKAVVIAIFILVFSLIIRLFQVQVLLGDKYARAASAQRLATADIEKPRGDIVDRNGIPFTNRNKKSIIIIKPLYLRGKEIEVEKVCSILGVDFNKVRREIEVKKEPILIETDEMKKSLVMNLNLEGISAVNTLKRYDEYSIARHITGYLNRIDQIGGSGIEKYYEDILKYDKDNTIGVITDARSNLVQGLGYRMLTKQNRDKDLSVKLTLDYHIQQTVEQIMTRNRVTGAVVVEDVSNGDILAIVSKPDFDQNDIGLYLNSSKNELFNRAVASYNLGSIFKIVDAAAYFENEIRMDEEHYCTGSIEIGDKVFRCYDGKSHGNIGLIEAFAQSCNTYFINMGIKTGQRRLLDMARRLGLGSASGIREQGVSESAGNLPTRSNYFTDGDIANISIGQGDIMATPLQVADLVATIANGGIKNSVNIVDSIMNSNFDGIQDVKVKEGTRVLLKETSDRIKLLMEEVIISGTAKNAKLEDYGGAGGKTGSAETGQYIEGKKVVHGWFAGYFPKRNPRYSIAIFVENGKSGSEAAVPIFAQIAEEILKSGF